MLIVHRDIAANFAIFTAKSPRYLKFSPRNYREFTAKLIILLCRKLGEKNCDKFLPLLFDANFGYHIAGRLIFQPRFSLTEVETNYYYQIASKERESNGYFDSIRSVQLTLQSSPRALTSYTVEPGLISDTFKIRFKGWNVLFVAGNKSASQDMAKSTEHSRSSN